MAVMETSYVLNEITKARTINEELSKLESKEAKKRKVEWTERNQLTQSSCETFERRTYGASVYRKAALSTRAQATVAPNKIETRKTTKSITNQFNQMKLSLLDSRDERRIISMNVNRLSTGTGRFSLSFSDSRGIRCFA